MIDRVVVPALLLVVLCGCGVGVRVVGRDGRARMRTVHGSAASAVQRAANEIPCATERLTLLELESGGYRVSGCGVEITYSCFRNLCVPDERSSTMGGSSAHDDVRMTSPTGSWSDAEVRQLHRSIHDSIVGCLPPETDSVRLQLSIGAQGVVRRIGAAVLPPDANACVDAILARGVMGRRVSASRSVFLEFRRGSLGLSASTTQPPGSAPPAEAAPAPPAIRASVDATVRAAIDGRALAILACVEQPALSFQISWSADGHLDALLRGERQGTPEEDCVRAIVRQLSIPAPGAVGTIVHAVQQP